MTSTPKTPLQTPHDVLPPGTPAAAMRDAVATFVAALRDLPADVRLLGGIEAVGLIIASSWPSDEVADVTATAITSLPDIVDRYERTIAADKSELLRATH